MELEQNIIQLLDFFGTSVAGISGVLMARKKHMDIFGAFVLACVTAVGGGTMRDLMLGLTPVFWINDPRYFWIVIITTIISVTLIRFQPKPPKWLFPVADAIGMATFLFVGANKALINEYSYLIAIFMGILTASGGGVIRDILANEIPLVLRTEIYATACMVGGILWALSLCFFQNHILATCICIFSALIIRLVAIKYNLSLPRLKSNEN